MLSTDNLAWTLNVHQPATKRYKNTAKDNTKLMQKDNSVPRETTVSIEYWTTTVSDVQDIVFQTVLKDKLLSYKMESTPEDVHCLLSVLLLNIVSAH